MSQTISTPLRTNYGTSSYILGRALVDSYHSSIVSLYDDDNNDGVRVAAASWSWLLKEREEQNNLT